VAGHERDDQELLRRPVNTQQDDASTFARGLLAGVGVYVLGVIVFSTVEILPGVPPIVFMLVSLVTAHWVARARSLRQSLGIIGATLALDCVASIPLIFLTCSLDVGYCPLR
jgi:hypothetical protein